MGLENRHREQLLDVAARAIAEGISLGLAWQPEPLEHEPVLRRPGACFVTLSRDGELRGCRGMLEPVRPLCQDVAHNAYLTAFDDPRFPPVTVEELSSLYLEVSVLSPLELLPVTNERELLACLRPGMDGLVLSDGFERATFLPKVWDKLPEPAEFLRHLKWKAGWPADYWSESLRVQRYGAECFGRELS